MTMPPRNVFRLEQLGWDNDWEREFAPFHEKDCIPGRVGIRHKGMYTILTEQGEVYARIKGYLRYTAETFAELPSVGDWVAIARKPHEELWRIQGVLERRTVLRRKVKGAQTVPQVLAANMTTVVVVMALTEDYNLRRLERYLVLVHESGAKPFVLLNKSDLIDDEELLQEAIADVREVAGTAPVAVASALHGDGVHALAPILVRGETLVFVGSSGAGKSTLVNTLLGEERFETAEIRESDGRGRHTTTRREMVLLPNGAIVIDSPGIREIQLWEAEEGFQEAFADIEELARQCRFRDCTHANEPGCAIRQAIEEEELDPERWSNYQRLRDELLGLRERGPERIEKAKRAFREMKKKRN